MPYRVDIHDRRDRRDGGDDALDRLIDLGALDVESSRGGGLAALLPDGVTPEHVASALGVGIDDLSVSRAVGRDADSVWVLSPRAVRIGRLRIVPADVDADLDAEPDAEPDADALRLIDASAFGTGLHPTTALCLEALDEATQTPPSPPDAVLDVGTGSGVLALAALRLGVPRVTAIDIDDDALRVAAHNARINSLHERVQFARGGPDTIAGTWPLVLANVLAAPLIEMAPALVRRVGHHGQLVLSGIPSSVEPDVDRAYRHLGMQRVAGRARDGWVALVLRASW